MFQVLGTYFLSNCIFLVLRYIWRNERNIKEKSRNSRVAVTLVTRISDVRVPKNSGTQRFKGVEEEDFKPHSASYAHLTEPHLNEEKNLDFDLTPKSKFAGHVRKPMSRVFAFSRFTARHLFGTYNMQFSWNSISRAPTRVKVCLSNLC